MNSETPETDAAVRECHNLPDIVSTDGPFRYVPADFARRLELRNKRLVEALQLVQQVNKARMISYFDTEHSELDVKHACEFLRSLELDNTAAYWCWFDKTVNAALTDQQEEKP